MAAVILLTIYLASLLLPGKPLFSENAEFALWALFAIALTLILVRPAYSLWLALDFWIHPWAPGD